MGFRFALRTLRRSPWYALTATGTIALSISLAATVFAVVDGVLFKPLPYASPDRLFHVQGSAGPGEGTASLSPADVRYLSEADARVRVAAYGGAAGLTHPDRPDLTIWSATIDRQFFDVLGQHPLVGNFIGAHYLQPVPGELRPAIVSHAFWRQWLGADVGAIGRTVDMASARLLVVGVLPHDFVFPSAFGRIRPDVLLPLVSSPAVAQDRWNRSLNAVARIGEAMTLEEAGSRLSAALAARAGEYPPRPQVRPGPYVAVSMRPIEQYLGANERPLFRLAFAGAALLVILGAINVAGLFAARGRDRQRELALRVALGAGRGALARMLLTEALLIAVAGSLMGLALAQPLLTVTLTLLPESLLLLKPPEMDWRVALFAILTATSVVIAFALTPAAATTRSALAQRLPAGTTNTARARSWARSTLLAGESAIGIALVVTGSLVLASFIVLRSEHAGFDSKGLAVLEVRTPGTTGPEDAQARHARVFDRIQRSPDVSTVATLHVPLLENMFGGSRFAAPTGASRFSANDIPVSGPFFEVARLRLLEGRVLSVEEIDTGHPFAVVSENIALEYWPGERAVGQTLTAQNHTVTVVGVVEEARFGAQDETQHGEIYLPAALAQRNWTVYLLRTTGDPDVVVRDVALAVHRDVPGVLVRRAESFDSALLKSVRLHRFRTVLFATAAAAGLLLLAVGVGGLVATSVAGRVREIGIRSALGAPRRRLVAMVVVEHLRPSLVGVAIGLLASWWTTRLMSAFLYRIDAHDPLVWLAAALCLMMIAALAAWIPARRASALDPMVVLRAE